MFSFIRYKRLIVLLCACAAIGNAMFSQRQRVRANTIDSLWRELSMAKTQQDSIRLLYDIYDANSTRMSATAAHDKNLQVLNLLHDVAMRAKDTVTALDAVRYMATVSRYDVPYVEMQLKRLSHMPNTVDKMETETFLKLQRYFWALRDTTASNEERRQNFYRIRAQVEKNKIQRSLYDRMDQQFALVLFGSNLIHAGQLEKYLMDLRRFVEMAPDKKDILKNYYFRIAAMLYDENQEGKKAIEADYKLLEILDLREKNHVAAGRKFKNYDNLRFIIYRRLLGNYNELHPDSVVSAHKKLQDLMKTLPPDQVTDLDRMTVDAMWNMYNKNYPKALQLLRGVVASKRFSDKPNYILAYLNAAGVLNSSEDLKNGQQLYTNLLINKARDAADTEYARMRIEYEIDTLEASTSSAMKNIEVAHIQSEREIDRYFIFAVIATCVFFIVIIILQVRARKKEKGVTQRLEKSNEELLKERDALQKTKTELEKANEKAREAVRQKSEFFHNVSHEISEPVKEIVGFSQLILDSIPEERRRYLSGFADIINHNSNILQRIVGDILDTAEIEDTVTSVTVSHFSPEKICNLVADAFRPRLNENQHLKVNPLRIIGQATTGEVGVDSDASRLEQILNNLLANAIKFCDHGTIEIDSEIDYNEGWLTISVTDEGPGIPKGKEKIIFERFEKLGSFNTGLGLGLYVSREIAHLLQGDITVDVEYQNGARFVVSLPISIRSGRLD